MTKTTPCECCRVAYARAGRRCSQAKKIGCKSWRDTRAGKIPTYAVYVASIRCVHAYYACCRYMCMSIILQSQASLPRAIPAPVAYFDAKRVNPAWRRVQTILTLHTLIERPDGLLISGRLNQADVFPQITHLLPVAGQRSCSSRRKRRTRLSGHSGNKYDTYIWRYQREELD